MEKIIEVELFRGLLEDVLENHIDSKFTHHDYIKRYQFILDVIDYASTQTVFYKLDILNNR
jgi:poly(A) polymerase Pap1